MAGWADLFLRNIPSLTFCKFYITLYCKMYWTFYYVLYCKMYCTQKISLYCIHHFSLRSRQMPMNETSKTPHQASRLQYSTVQYRIQYSTVCSTVQYTVYIKVKCTVQYSLQYSILYNTVHSLVFSSEYVCGSVQVLIGWNLAR
mgnify:CR=1 FL=1